MCGVGVVGSANGGIPESIGKNGIIVSESDNFTQDFANAVIDYLKNPLSQQIILQNIGDCSWRECVLQEIQIYNNIAPPLLTNSMHLRRLMRLSVFRILTGESNNHYIMQKSLAFHPIFCLLFRIKSAVLRQYELLAYR